MSEEKPKIGVFVCHCGRNIAATVDVHKIAEHFDADPELIAKEEIFLCSEAGQENIKETIRENGLEYVVIASCSPVHHGDIFAECVGEEMNKYMWEMANIREQCSWVHDDMDEGTEKAIALIRGSINRVKEHMPIGTMDVPVVQEAMVIGGGIAGLHTALEIADKGIKVHLIEKSATIGGNMVKLDRTFPTDDCSMCTISPILFDAISEENIVLHTTSEVMEFHGRPGDYHAKVLKRTRKIKEDICTGCGECTTVCPVYFRIQPTDKPSVEPPVQDKEVIDGFLDKHSELRNSLIPVLLDVNEHYKYIPRDVIQYLSFKMDIPVSKIVRIATFYKAFSLEPKGKFHIKVCLGTACYVRGGENLHDKIQQLIEDTPEGMFTVEAVNCLGACALGPIMVVNDEYHGNLTLADAERIIGDIKGGDGE